MKYVFGALLLNISMHVSCEGNGRNLHRYFWANRLQFSGQMKDAYNWYQQIYRSNGPVQTNIGYIQFLFDTGNYKQIIALEKTIGNRLDNHAQAQLTIALAHKKIGDNNSANAKLISLSKNFKTNPEIVFNAIGAFIEQKDLNGALALIEDFTTAQTERSKSFIFYFLKAQIYVQLGKPQKALESIQETLAQNPHFDKAWLLFAALQEEMGQINEAIKGYNTFLQLTSQGNKQIEHHLLKLMLKQQAVAQKGAQPIAYRSPIERALLHFNQHEYDQALVNVEQHLISDPECTKARLLKIQILTAQKKSDEATTLLITWIEKDLTNVLWFQALHLLYSLPDHGPLVISALEKLETNHPESLLAQLYLADTLIRAEKRDQALIHLQRAQLLTSDNALRTNILFQIGLITYNAKKYSAMKEALEQGIQLNTDYPPLLNLLSYYYATQEINLEKALLLIEKALGKDPHNPHFLDTKATIFYKQGKLNEALTLLERAVQDSQHDATILIHLAKTYHKMGSNHKALALIKDAITKSKNSYEKTKSIELLNSWSSSPHEQKK